MRTPPNLSSPLTFLCEWVIPVCWLLAGLQQIKMALIGTTFRGVIWVIVIVWGIGFIVILIYSWPIKLVTLEGDYFVISNYFTSRRVPINHLTDVGESALVSRGPTIILYFEPPTPFGKRVRLITPLFAKNSDDEIAAFLRSLIRNRCHRSLDNA